MPPISATKIKTYQESPLRFKFANILFVPEPKTTYSAIGTAVHAVVHQLTETQKQGLELTEEIAFELVIFDGVIDRIERTPSGEYEVIDFKTGSVKENNRSIKENIQLNLYALGVQKLYGKLPKKATLFYLKHDKFISYEIADSQVQFRKSKKYGARDKGYT